MKTQNLGNDNLVSISGTKLYVEKAGKGETVLLIHAGIADNRMWDKQFDLLSKTNTVIRFDLRGCGDSKMSSGAFSHQQDILVVS
ncbi:MAG: alpha/beta hydrolase [Chloroflexi bacterium]|nr:alpha/beta hydrolase [Chloroflexota bacterium]MCP4798567.1 alpha/beta hydrolase [bacterium]